MTVYTDSVFTDALRHVRSRRQTIIPESAGADALVVRDAGNTENRLSVTEDFKIKNLAGDVMLKFTSAEIQVRNLADTAYRDVRAGTYVAVAGIAFYHGAALRPTPGAADRAYILQSHDGTSFVSCIRLVGGYAEILRAKLVGNIVMKPFDPGTSVTVDAGSTYTIPEGVYYVNLAANTSAEVYDDVAAAWVTVVPAGGKGLVISDGTNARLYNAGTVAETSNLRRVF